MKKKRFYVISIILIITLFNCKLLGRTINELDKYSYNKKYKNWQSVEITNVGTFNIPKEWIITIYNGAIYITDKQIDKFGFKIYLIGIYNRSKYNSNIDFFIDYFEYIESMEHVGFFSHGVAYSNSARYYGHEYKINNIIEKKYSISFVNRENIYIDLIAWDNLIDEKTIEKIAESWRTAK